MGNNEQKREVMQIAVAPNLSVLRSCVLSITLSGLSLGLGLAA